MPISILEKEKSLALYKEDMIAVFNTLKTVFESGGRLFICGNGGSFADSIHIAGELVKSFEKKRPLNDTMKERFKGLYGEDVLTEQLEYGLPAHVLGTNSSLSTALLNDCSEKEIMFAQEVFVLGREGDGIILLHIPRDVLLEVLRLIHP
jgi:D-sedoheptulose 7-phosphate isomerase